jgi:hypothetical protein
MIYSVSPHAERTAFRACLIHDDRPFRVVGHGEHGTGVVIYDTQGTAEQRHELPYGVQDFLSSDSGADASANSFVSSRCGQIIALIIQVRVQAFLKRRPV